MPLIVPPSLASALAQPVAILGGGVSGEGVRALLAAIGATGELYDAQGARGADFTAVAARKHALVVHSPGFAPEHPWLQRARAAGARCLGELDFAAGFWRGRLVAVTGTNGKTTLTEFLTQALKSVEREAFAVGNIGYPLSRLVAETAGGAREATAVCEVSSFQAETLEQLRPDATLWTNFAEDHLERHGTLAAYFAAKWNLVRRTAAKAVFLGSSVHRAAAKFERPLAGTFVVATERQPSDVALTDTVFADYPQRENYLLAAAWWQAAGFAPAALRAAARSFALGPHRLARVGEVEGVTYWNDSKATNFHAVEAALARFPEPVVLIAGGKSKGGDLAAFVHRISARVRHALLIGETSGELALHAATFRVAHSSCGSLAEAVRRAAEFAPAGGHVLLSPGFASFDMFRSYEDRGAQFVELVEQLATPAALR